MADTPNTSRAIARYMRVSPQKARLVVDLIRGKKAEDALHLLRFARKRVAPDVEKLLQSAIANAAERLDMDVDSLYVTTAFVNEGPRQKRVRPAPMGRAYRYQRRTSHIEIHVGARPGSAILTQRPAAPAAAPAVRKPAGAALKRKPAGATKKKSTISRLASERTRVKPSKPSAPSRKGGSKNKGGE